MVIAENFENNNMDDETDSDSPIIDNNVIRIQLRKPKNRKWELKTCSSPENNHIEFPIIQLFDCDGNILLETNDDHISINSADIKNSVSFSGSVRKRGRNASLSKNNTIAGDKVYTKVYNNNVVVNDANAQTENIPHIEKLFIQCPSRQSSVDSLSVFSVLSNDSYSSYKSSDNETSSACETRHTLVSGKAGTLLLATNKVDYSPNRRRRVRVEEPLKPIISYNKPSNAQLSVRAKSVLFDEPLKDDEENNIIQKSKSFHTIEGLHQEKQLKESLCPFRSVLNRAQSQIIYSKPANKVSFIDTYLKSLPENRNIDKLPAWCNRLNKDDRTNAVKDKVQKYDDSLKESNARLRPMNRFSNELGNKSQREAKLKENLKKNFIPNMNNKYTPARNFIPQPIPKNNNNKVIITPNDYVNTKTKSILYEGHKHVKQKWPHCQVWDDRVDSDVLNLPSDEAAETIIKRRLREYRKGVSLIDYRSPAKYCDKRRNSDGDYEKADSSSSESPDEADLVINRLKRRIIINRMREKRNGRFDESKYRRRLNNKRNFHEDRCRSVNRSNAVSRCNCETCIDDLVNRRENMGSNLSHHNVKGLTGRRARSSGDLCNADTKSQTDVSVYGSVAGENMGWNRSLPNHLDSNRFQTNYDDGSNNNYEIANGRYPNKRAARYRPSKAGSDHDPVWKLQDAGCDQGYGSERSPEDEFPGHKKLTLDHYLRQLRVTYPFITEENTFTVSIEKDGRGLGMSVSSNGETGLVRIRRLYPPQPAWRTGMLEHRDILIAANGVPLVGLSTYEALEVLRTAGQRVELLVCRSEEGCISPPHQPPPAPPRITSAIQRDPLNCHPAHTKLTHTVSNTTTSSSEGRCGGSEYQHSPQNSTSGQYTEESIREGDTVDGGARVRPKLTLPGEQQQDGGVNNVQYGEFDIVMTKVNGSLGFTLRKEDQSALGHYVRALVREPAVSDGRIQPGDRIVAVNDMSLSTLSHAEAVQYLRTCGDTVLLRLYREHAPDVLSPTEECPPHGGHLRQEAVNMLCELAARRGNTRRRRPQEVTTNTIQESPSTETDTLEEHQFKQLVSHDLCETKTSMPEKNQNKLVLTVAPNGYELNNLDNDVLDAPNVYQDQKYLSNTTSYQTDEPMSMPLEVNEEKRFFHKNPAYQSAMVHSSGENGASDSSKDEGKGLKKWKAVTLSPDNERKQKIENFKVQAEVIHEQKPIRPKEVDDAPVNGVSNTANLSNEPTILTVELNRGWNSRLGFSVQCHPESGQSYISAIYSDSVTAKDGRLRKGDIILQVNDESVTSMKTPEVIDLLRILRGSICITILRPSG